MHLGNAHMQVEGAHVRFLSSHFHSSPSPDTLFKEILLETGFIEEISTT